MSTLARFSFPTAIIYGPGAVTEVSKAIKELGASKTIIVTDPFLAKTENFQSLIAVLEDANIPYIMYSEIHANPLDSDLDKAVQLFRSNNCDVIIGIGGGSALDAAKALAVLSVNEGTLADYDVQQGGSSKIHGSLPPVIAIPTTAGTGSEVGKCAVITSSTQHRKFMVCHPDMLPKRAILDPELTVSLPAHLTAATGMDALTHNIEALTAPVFNPLCDAIAVKGIELVVTYLELAVKEPTNLEARGNMMIGAAMGAIAFQKDLGAAHSLSHALSAVCGLHHGLANAICLVPVMRYNLDLAKEQYALIAPYFGINSFEMSPEEAAEKAIEQIRLLNKRIGIPDSLKDAGVKEDQFKEIAGKAFLDPCHRTNVRPCTEKDLYDLLKESWLGV